MMFNNVNYDADNDGNDDAKYIIIIISTTIMLAVVGIMFLKSHMSRKLNTVVVVVFAESMMFLLLVTYTLRVQLKLSHKLIFTHTHKYICIHAACLFLFVQFCSN